MDCERNKVDVCVCVCVWDAHCVYIDPSTPINFKGVVYNEMKGQTVGYEKGITRRYFTHDSLCSSPMPIICTTSVRMKLYSLVQLMSTRVVVNQEISQILLINNWSISTRLIIVQAMLASILMVGRYVHIYMFVLTCHYRQLSLGRSFISHQ